MKIDLIGPSYPFKGGISCYSTLLFKHLKKTHETRFYAFKRQYPRFLYPGKTDRDWSGRPLMDKESQPSLDSLNPLSWLSTAVKIIHDKPDVTIFPWWVVYWAPSFLSIIFLLKLLSKTKILFICHNIQEHETHPIKLMISKYVLSQADFFIVHSKEDRKSLIRTTGKTMVKVNFHPTYDVFNTREIDGGGSRQKLGISEENVILFFGFVRPYKGLRYLLEAMPLILEKIDARLIIAGEFWESKDAYLKSIDELHIGNKVTIIDAYIPNEDIPLFFHASDIVVLPYLSVTGSGLIQLAFGFNKPVVVSEIGSLSEVVRDKETGFLVPPKNPQAVANAVTSFFMKSEKDAMAEAIKRERNKFSWEHLVKTIEDFLPCDSQ